jgi:hypothetical protein
MPAPGFLISMNHSSSILIAAFGAVIGGAWIVSRFEPGSGTLDIRSPHAAGRSAATQGTPEGPIATSAASDSSNGYVAGTPAESADSARASDLNSPHGLSGKMHDLPDSQSLNKPNVRKRRISVADSPKVDPTGHAVAPRIPRSSQTFQSASVPQPAVWVDLENSPGVTPAQQDEIQKSANELRDKIANSGLDPASQEYRDLWTLEVDQSDRIFRQRYGVKAWLQHHVHSYHLAHPTPP